MSTENKALKVSRLAKAAADVLKGAATGGPCGAVIGAVKAVLPSLVKPLLYALLGVFLLIFTIYYALPSSMYAFDGVDNADIQAMNRNAAELRTLYTKFAEFTDSAADAIAAEIPAEGYDAVAIIKKLDALGPEWTAAICSVLYTQELPQIGEEELKELAYRYVEYETDEESFTEEIPPESEDEEGEGETTTTTVTRRRLLIYLNGVGAEKLMERLDFSEQEKEWARFLHDNLTLSQYLDPELGSGEDMGELGDLVFTEGGREVVYYNQRDQRWAYHPYGSYTVSETACGPASLAMAVSTLSGQTVTPDRMADWAYRHGYCMPEGGSYHSLIPEGARSFGLTAEGVGRDGQKVLNALADGKLVIAIMGPGTFTTGGHYIVLRGVTEAGKILVADSYSYGYSQREWDFSLILREARSYAAANGPFWIIGEGDRNG